MLLGVGGGGAADSLSVGGDPCRPLHAGLSLLSDARQELLDLSDGAARVEALGAGLRAVHDGVAPANKDILTLIDLRPNPMSLTGGIESTLA